jgi:hypothetical protein
VRKSKRMEQTKYSMHRKKSPDKIQVENLKKKETILGILESDMSILKLTLEKYGC